MYVSATASGSANPNASSSGPAANVDSSNIANNPLADLLRVPQFGQIRELAQRQPQLLPALLQRVGQSDPALLQRLNDNREALFELLNAPGPGHAMDEDPPGGAGQRIEMDAETNAAVERLSQLGFDRTMCLQAYLACEKNEMLAANWLLEHGGGM